MKYDADIFKKAEHDINELRNKYTEYLEKISDIKCDKFGFKFNGDNRFSSFTINVSLDSYTGYYGNSGCSQFLYFREPEIVKRAFVIYLNKHIKEILDGMADIIEKEYAEEKEKYIKDLEYELNRVKGL